MQTTDSNETPKRRLEDQHPAEKINWEAPGAPAVPAAPIAPRAAPLRAVASMSVSADGISFFATPSAHLLEHGHYMLPAPGAEFRPSAVPVKDLPARLQRDHERGILHPNHAHQCDVCREAGAAQPQAAAASPSTDTPELRKLLVEYAVAVQENKSLAAMDGARAAIFEHVAQLSRQQAAPAVPEGWKLVPVEPTEDMVVRGFESKPDPFFSKPAVWVEYDAMTGCQQAAYRAKLCWAAMIAAAPAAPSASADAAKLEQIAASWDGCMVDAPGETMDVGATLRLQFKDAASADAVIETRSDLEQTLMEKRIELIPEYEGEWRAYVYLDSEEPQATAVGATPSAAVDAAIKGMLRTGKGAGQ